MKKFASLLLLLPLISCVSLTVDEPSVCDTVSLGTFPGSPIAIVAPPPESYSTQEDFSGTLQKINDVTSDYSVAVTELMLTAQSDLSWVSAIQVYIQGISPTLPKALMATYQVGTANSSPPNSLNMTVTMDGDTLVSYLRHPVTLTFNVVAFDAPTTTTTLGATFCVAANATLTKSL